MQTVTLEWEGSVRFRAHAGEAVTVIDGNGSDGPSPVNLMLESLGACAAADVVDILARGRQEVEALTVLVRAERRAEPPRYVKKLELRFRIKGPVDEAKAQRAVDLSLQKYCSVFHSMRMDIALDVDVEVVS
jgi:putative redox protein